MRRGSIMLRRASVAAVLCALAGVLAAHPAHAEVTVKAALDRAQVAIGETADLGVEVQGVQNSGVPSIADAGGTSVSYLGPSSRVSFVNGAMSASVTHHFSVSAAQAGKRTIGPITVEVQG